MPEKYIERRKARSEFAEIRGLNYHLHVWGRSSLVTPTRPALIMLHGWMDVGASFQFIVDAMEQDRYIVAPDWRGFGLTESPRTDSYWFADYLGDLDALGDLISPQQPFDLVGHSMGGNVAMMYAGVRPQRVRRMVNLEGFGMSPTQPEDAPKRLTEWLDQLKQPARFRDYDSIDAVAKRMRDNNPRLPPERAYWLAGHWARATPQGRWVLNADAVHRRTNPILARREEAVAIWSRITAPMLWVEGSDDALSRFWRGTYPREDFEARMAVVPQVERLVIENAGHMMHHDEPLILAQHMERFLDRA
jgi:pimeloyl-ACP methyl ester carboxylesterase